MRYARHDDALSIGNRRLAQDDLIAFCRDLCRDPISRAPDLPAWVQPPAFHRLHEP